MRRSQRPRIDVIAVLLLVVACSCSGAESSTSYPGDPLAAIEANCTFLQTHKGCDSSCINDLLNINEFGGTVCEGSKPLDDVDPKTFEPYYTCRNACASTQCASVPKKQSDCACTRRCAELHLSRRVQGLLAYEGDCGRALPRCQ